MHQTFHFTAANTTPEQNRQQLIADAAAWSGIALRPEDYPNWRTVFRMLMELKAPEPLVVVLDECQYFGTDTGSLSHVASELNAVWEQRRSALHSFSARGGEVASGNEARKPESPLLFVAAGGFAPGFQVAARASGHPVTLWTLKDLYSPRLNRN